MSTIIASTLTAAAVLIAWLTFRRQFAGEKKEQMDHLVIQFEATRTLSKKVRESLKLYAQKTDGYESVLFTGITVKRYLKELEISYNTNLGNDLLEKIKMQKLPKPTMTAMTKSLEDQFQALMLIDKELSIKLDGLDL